MQETACLSADEGGMVFVTRESVEKFIVACIEQTGLPCSHARTEAAVLVDADCKGKTSHGLELLDMRLTNIEAGTIVGAEPVVEKEAPCSALVDGAGCLGSVVADVCMGAAIQKALTSGIGWVSAKRSHHIGCLGWYAMKACRKGLIGLCMSNTWPSLVAPRSKQRSMGTNPICIAAPGLNGDYLLFDSSLSATAMGKVRERVRCGGEGVPEGWGVDGDGLPSRDAASIFGAGGVLPLGGFGETAGGHKGFGLVLLVEVLTSVLAGSAFCSELVRSKAGHCGFVGENLGQTFVVINPSHFGDGFLERMQRLLDYCRHLDPVDASMPVLIPGDKGRKCNQGVEKDGGLWYRRELIENLNGRMVKLGGRVFLEDERTKGTA